jgi:hypothetical protein
LFAIQIAGVQACPPGLPKHDDPAG